MPRPRTPKPHPAASREGSGEESDATLDPSTSVQATRRTRKRPAQMAREGSADQAQSGRNSPFRSHTRVEDSTEDEVDTQAAEQQIQSASAPAPRNRNYDLRASTSATYMDVPHSSSAFATQNQARDRPALVQSSSFTTTSNVMQPTRSNMQQRSARSSRSNMEIHPQTSQHALRRTASAMQPNNIPSRSSSSPRNAAESVPQDSADVVMPLAENSTQLSGRSALSSDVRQPLASRAGNEASQASSSSADCTTSMSRTTSNMSPPRPTRSLPRRRASARTQTRPLLSSSNSSSSSYALRSRSTSSSNILGSSSSNANILASSSNSRQNSMTGCMPLGGGFDPSYNPPSGMSMPRTPLAEIPLWLADMRSESRRSSTSSSSFMDREEYLSAAASRSMSSRHARTLSSSSSGPSSPGATRNGSTSPVVPFRRSLRGGRPRQSDENARISPSPSYFGEYDAIPSSSSASLRDENDGRLEDASNPNAGLTSSMIHLGTSSPATPSVQVQTSSPAMSTRSRTLNRAGSVRNRRLTNPLNTPVPIEMATRQSESQAQQSHELLSSFRSARNAALQQARARNADEPRSSSLLERRAATAAAAATGTSAAAPALGRVVSRPSSRTSSPARGTRASRRRSTAAEGQEGMPMEATSLGPRPANLTRLQIPGAPLAPDAGLLLFHVPTPSSMMVEDVNGQQSVLLEPVSPSAFSEMTSLTQGSTASESMNSTAGMPATPSSSTSTLDPFAQSMQHEGGRLEAGSSSSQTRRTRAVTAADNAVDVDGDATLPALDSTEVGSTRPLRQAGHQRKSYMNADDDALGVQLRPRP